MRLTRGAAMLLAAAVLAAVTACAPAEDEEDRALFEDLLAVEQVDGVLYASSWGILLDLDSGPEAITAAALDAVAVLDERAWSFDVTFLLARAGVADAETEFTFELDEPREGLEQRLRLWAGLVTSGFIEVRMNIFREGSEYGDGVISVEGWRGDGPAPSLAQAYTDIVASLDGTHLEPSRMQVNVDLGGVQILNDNVALPVADGLLETVERVTAQWLYPHSTVSVQPELTTVTLARDHDGFGWVPFTDEEAAGLRAEFAAAGLLTPTLRIVGVRGENGPIWGEAP